MNINVKTQLRKAVQARLSSALPELKTVCGVTRMSMQFQSHDLPVASVTIKETGAPLGGGRMGDRPTIHSYSVSVMLGVSADIEELEDALEALELVVKAALSDGDDLGLPGVRDWRWNDASEPTILFEAELGVLPLTYTCTITTPPGDDSKSI